MKLIKYIPDDVDLEQHISAEYNRSGCRNLALIVIGVWAVIILLIIVI